MLRIFLKPLSWLSLTTIHRWGAIVGRIVFLLSPQSRHLIYKNLEESHLYKDEHSVKQAAKLSSLESGKSILETLAIWQWPQDKAVALVKSCHNWHLVKDALARGKGLIFLTPHLGCFEITSIYYASKHPITVLFRPPKKSWLSALIDSGRSKGQVKLAPANMQGVRALMQALKKGEAVGILPDQIPAAGEGEWADFFGKPAYTMTLASKLAEKTGATVIMAYGERLTNGEGYEIHLTKLDSIATPALLNQAIERQIAQKPEQYLWRYNRYKARRHAVSKANSPESTI